MKILALDTATENCSAALLIDGTLLTREEELERGHAERILPMIDELLSEAQVALTDLDAIGFGRGPGSFTGVRLAATVTQGLAFGASLGVVPISDLQAVAQRAFGADASLARVVVCNDARMSEVYWACYERDANGLARLEGEEHVGKPSDVRLPAKWSNAMAVGRGFIAYAEALRTAMPAVTMAANGAPHPHAAEAAPGGALPGVTQAAPGTALPGVTQAAPGKALPGVTRAAPGASLRAGARSAAPGAPPAAIATTATRRSSIVLTQLLPRAAEIALLTAPLVTAGQVLPPESAVPVYLRDNVAHVAQPSKPAG